MNEAPGFSEGDRVIQNRNNYDRDAFNMNQASHPFHGSLYFNAARSTTNNQFVSLNPQYPTALTATRCRTTWRISPR